MGKSSAEGEKNKTGQKKTDPRKKEGIYVFQSGFHSRKCRRPQKAGKDRQK